jgi:hypothetical protein
VLENDASSYPKHRQSLLFSFTEIILLDLISIDVQLHIDAQEVKETNGRLLPWL